MQFVRSQEYRPISIIEYAIQSEEKISNMDIKNGTDTRQKSNIQDNSTELASSLL